MPFKASDLTITIGLKTLIISIWDNRKMMVFILFKPVIRSEHETR